MDRYNTAKEKAIEAQKELEALQIALDNEVKLHSSCFDSELLERDKFVSEKNLSDNGISK